LYHGLHLRYSSSISLIAYLDADVDDRAGNVDDCISTSAYIVFLGSNPISWSTRKQRAVTCYLTKT
jgi:hypothetical protein